MKRLHINVDHCATLRQARGTLYPDPVFAAGLAELAGAHGITVHLREDRRHIQERDVRILRQTVRTLLNLEMAAVDEMVQFALDVRPDLVTLVPERREERTTEGGLDLALPGLLRTVTRLTEAGIDVSLFVAPEMQIVTRARELGATMIELHTGEYCDASRREQDRHLEHIARCANAAAAAGLRVAAGHGLDYVNVRPIVAIPEIEELNIGHSIVSRALLVGMERAVREMLALVSCS